MPATVIMVHGAFCGGWAFDVFKAPFEAQGYRCLTPDLPGHGPGECDRVAAQSMTDYARAIADMARDCDEPPVLMGHSLGGLVSLMAAARVQTSGLILIAPSSPWGVSTAAMEDAVSAIGLISLNAYWGSAVDPDRSLFNTYGGERLPPPVRDEVFSKLVPESGRALAETLNWWMDPFMTTTVPTWQMSAPALFLAGGRDRVHSANQVRKTAARFNAACEVFPDMSHWMLAEDGWREVAEAALVWMAGALRKAA